MEIKDPKCPACEAVGADKIAMSPGAVLIKKTKEPFFNICHCAICGHVYGIISGIITGTTVSPPQIGHFGLPK